MTKRLGKSYKIFKEKLTKHKQQISKVLFNYVHVYVACLCTFLCTCLSTYHMFIFSCAIFCQI